MAAPSGGPWKRPESVLVVVHTVDGRVLMLRRRAPADFWQSVTGSLEWGETPAAAAVRELREETGLEAQGRLCAHPGPVRFPILPAWRARYAPGVRYNVEHAFSVEYPMTPTIRLDGREHVAYRWLPWREARELAASWTDRAAIARSAGGGAGG